MMYDIERVRRSTMVLPPPRLISRTHDSITLRPVAPAQYRAQYPLRYQIIVVHSFDDLFISSYYMMIVCVKQIGGDLW